MSIASRDRLPPLRYSQSYGLRGLERVTPQKSPLSRTFRDSLYKPLPPVPNPRRVSSVYSLQVDDIIDLYTDWSLKDEQLYQKIFFSTTAVDSAYSRNSSIKVTEARLRSRYLTQQESDILAINDWLEAIKAKTAKSGSSLQLNTSSSPTKSTRGASSPPTRSPREVSPRSLAPISKMNKPQSREPSTPSTFHSVQYEVEVNYPDAPLSPRIVDVVDHSLVPSPLRASQHGGSDKTTSRLSRASTGSASDMDKIRNSIRNRLRKSHQAADASNERKENRRAMSVASAKYPNMNLPPSGWRERINSAASERRVSIQQSVSHVCESLTNLSIKPKQKPAVNPLSPTPKRGPRGPTMPIAPSHHHHHHQPTETGGSTSRKPPTPPPKSPRKLLRSSKPPPPSSHPPPTMSSTPSSRTSAKPPPTSSYPPPPPPLKSPHHRAPRLLLAKPSSGNSPKGGSRSSPKTTTKRRSVPGAAKIRFPFLDRDMGYGVGVRESERRREALKKRIVVTGFVDHGLDGEFI